MPAARRSTPCSTRSRRPEPRHRALLGIEPSGKITVLLTSRAQFEQALAHRSAAARSAASRNGRFRVHLDSDHRAGPAYCSFPAAARSTRPWWRPTSARAAPTGSTASSPPRAPAIGTPRWSGTIPARPGRQGRRRRSMTATAATRRSGRPRRERGSEILPGTGRGTMRSMVEGPGFKASLPPAPSPRRFAPRSEVRSIAPPERSWAAGGSPTRLPPSRGGSKGWPYLIPSRSWRS